MNRKIYFATTNQGKINEAKSSLGIEVEGVGLNIDEVQSLDPNEVGVKKAREYFKKAWQTNFRLKFFVHYLSLIFNGRLYRLFR